MSGLRDVFARGMARPETIAKLKQHGLADGIKVFHDRNKWTVSEHHFREGKLSPQEMDWKRREKAILAKVDSWQPLSPDEEVVIISSRLDEWMQAHWSNL